MYGFVDHLLLDSGMENKFRKQTQVKQITFNFLCKSLDLYLRKDDICFRDIGSTLERVAVSLHR